MKRNNERIPLPNGCECSQLTVHPANWNTDKAKTDKAWYISYRFYSPQGSEPIQARGMNNTKDLTARQILTRQIRSDLLSKLQKDGFNPITGEYTAPPREVDNDYMPSLLFYTLSTRLSHPIPWRSL